MELYVYDRFYQFVCYVKNATILHTLTILDSKMLLIITNKIIQWNPLKPNLLRTGQNGQIKEGVSFEGVIYIRISSLVTTGHVRYRGSLVERGFTVLAIIINTWSLILMWLEFSHWQQGPILKAKQVMVLTVKRLLYF